MMKQFDFVHLIDYTFNYKTALNKVEASINKVNLPKYDLVIVSDHAPWKGGVELSKSIQRMKINKSLQWDIKVILISTDYIGLTAPDLQQLGIEGYCQLPITLDMLILTIQGIYEKKF